MKELNDILKDESNNDYMLISEVARYIRKHKDGNKAIDKKFVKDVLNIILSNYEPLLNGYNLVDFKEIFFKKDNVYGTYNNKIMEIDLTNIYRDLKDEKNIRLAMYYEILDTIFHELTHATQEKLVKNFEGNLYESSYELLNKDYDKYLFYYYKLPIEYLAFHRGNMMTYQVLSRVYDKKDLIDIKRKELFILYGHYEKNCNGKLVSPQERFKKVINKNNLTIINTDFGSNRSLYERLYLGLKISDEEYEKLKELFNKLSRRSNDEELINNDLKTLVRKIENSIKH